MGVTNYFSVDGEVIAESGASGYLSYHRDNLGSVCATLDSSGALVHQYQYKPFGELWSASGAGAQERRLQWCGSWGYSAIALTRKFLSYYVRARHYAAILGNWTSVDPLWPSEMAYGYVDGRVMTGVDYWGERRRKNSRRRGKPNKGINTRGQHGIWHEPSPPPKSINDRIDGALGIPFLKRLSKINDVLEAFSGCIGPLLVQSFYLQPVGVNPIGNWSIEEKRRICEGCCETAFALSGGFVGGYLGFHAGTFGGVIVGGIVGLPTGGMVGLSTGMTAGGIAGGTIGGIVGGVAGSAYGSHLAQGLCPDICRKLIPCPPGSNGVDSPWGPGVNRPTTYLA